MAINTPINISRQCKRGSLEERFWPKVRKGSPDDCWVWTGAKMWKGYGVIGVGASKTLRAHVAVWVLSHGPIESGTCVLHRCDNRACVNPAHLFLGSPRDNSADMVAKGRSLCGDSQPMSKLSEGDARQIRELLRHGVARKEVAERFGIQPDTVSDIGARRRWRHIP